MIIGILAILISALGGTLARMYGAGGYLPRVPLALLCTLPFAVVCAIMTLSPFAVLAFLGAFGITTGHGQYLSITDKKILPEKLDFIVRLFFGKDPRTDFRLVSYYGIQKLRWRNAFGMFVTGSVVGLPASIVCMSFDHKAAILLSLTGVVKAFAYRITDDTEASEWMNGFFRTLLCGLAVMV
jgi:hypothetical protein